MIENKNYNFLVLKIENEEDLLEYEFNEDLEYLFKKYFTSISGFYDLTSPEYFQISMKRGIYHISRTLAENKETTIIVNFDKFLDDEISYELFPFSTWRFIKQIVRDIRLDNLID